MDSAPSDHPPAERQDLDPAIIDTILGKPDAVQMKEDMAIAVDDTKSEDERINALDHMEMVSLWLHLTWTHSDTSLCAYSSSSISIMPMVLYSSSS